MRLPTRESPTVAHQENAARRSESATLPLEVDEAMTEEPHSALVRQFFENLLPEGQALDDAASTHRVSKGNLMGLLAALGGETAGALQLRLPGTDVTPAAATRSAGGTGCPARNAGRWCRGRSEPPR